MTVDQDEILTTDEVAKLLKILDPEGDPISLGQPRQRPAVLPDRSLQSMAERGHGLVRRSGG